MKEAKSFRIGGNEYTVAPIENSDELVVIKNGKQVKYISSLQDLNETQIAKMFGK